MKISVFKPKLEQLFQYNNNLKNIICIISRFWQTIHQIYEKYFDFGKCFVFYLPYGTVRLSQPIIYVCVCVCIIQNQKNFDKTNKIKYLKISKYIFDETN